MATTHSDGSRPTLRPFPMVSIEGDAVPGPVKREPGSLRPVVGPGDATVDDRVAATGGAAGLSRRGVLGWTIASGILGLIALIAGSAALWQPGPHAASPVLPDAVRAQPASAAEPVPPAQVPAPSAAPAAAAKPAEPKARQARPHGTSATSRKAATPAKRTTATATTPKGPASRNAPPAKARVERRPNGPE